MAGAEEAPPGRSPHPAGPDTPPCRAVPRVHAFGKGGQALRRDPRAPPAMRGWLRKQDSSGLRLWKRRWFVLVDLCLYYYRDSSEQRVRGGLPLPGYEIRVLPPAPRAPHAPQFLFTAEHPGMRTYCLGAETPEELNAWVCALRRGASPLPRSPQDPRGVGPPSPPLPAPCPPHAPSLLHLEPSTAPQQGGALRDPQHRARQGTQTRGNRWPLPPAAPRADHTSNGEEPEGAAPSWSIDQSAAAPSGRQRAGRSGGRHLCQSDAGFSNGLL